MNQIIFPEKIENNYMNYRTETLKARKVYLYLFIFSVMSLTIFIGYYSFSYVKLINIEKNSKSILDSYDIQRLYSTSTTSIKLPSVVSKSR